MLIVALVLAVVSLAALVTAVVTSNEVIAWVCIGLSALGVLLLIVDAIRDRNRAAVPADLAEDRTEVIAPVEVSTTEVLEPVESQQAFVAADDGIAEYPEDEDGDGPDPAAADETPVHEIAVEDHPDEVIYDDPDHDTPSDDEASYPVPAEQAAIHVITEDDLAAEEAENEAYDEPVTVVDSGEATYTITYAEVPPAESPTATVSYVGGDDVDEMSHVTGEYAEESSYVDESGADHKDH